MRKLSYRREKTGMDIALGDVTQGGTCFRENRSDHFRPTGDPRTGVGNRGGVGREMLKPFGPGQLVLAAIHPADTPSLGMVTDSLLQKPARKKGAPAQVHAHPCRTPC